jgi:hypothetical protein
VHQEIVLGESGQVFEVEASVLPRAPVSVVVTSHAGEVQPATLSCSIDPVSTLLSEDAPRGARVLHVGSTQGIVPNARYDVGGQRITVYRLDGAHRLILRRPLLEPAREDTPLRGCRILAPIDDAWVRDGSKLAEPCVDYTLVWTHAGGTEHTTADLVRVALHARVTADDVELRFPGWQRTVDDPARAIAEAAEIVRRDVLRYLKSRRADVATVRELVILRARLVAVEEAVMFRGEPYDRLVAAEAPYQAGIAALAPLPAAPPTTPPPVAPAEPPARYSVEHVRIVDEVMAWFAARPYVDSHALRSLQDSHLVRVRTADERHAVALFIAAQTNLSKSARRLRRDIVRRLGGETVAADQDLEKIDFSRVHRLDWLGKWLAGRHVLRVRDAVHLQRYFLPHLTTRDECEDTARLLRGRRPESDLASTVLKELVQALFAKSFAIGDREDA